MYAITSLSLSTLYVQVFALSTRKTFVQLLRQHGGIGWEGLDQARIEVRRTAPLILTPMLFLFPIDNRQVEVAGVPEVSTGH